MCCKFHRVDSNSVTYFYIKGYVYHIYADCLHLDKFRFLLLFSFRNKSSDNTFKGQNYQKQTKQFLIRFIVKTIFFKCHNRENCIGL